MVALINNNSTRDGAAKICERASERAVRALRNARCVGGHLRARGRSDERLQRQRQQQQRASERASPEQPRASRIRFPRQDDWTLVARHWTLLSPLLGGASRRKRRLRCGGVAVECVRACARHTQTNRLSPRSVNIGASFCWARSALITQIDLFRRTHARTRARTHSH